MYFRRKLGLIRIAAWIGLSLIAALGEIKQGRPLWIGAVTFLICILLFVPSYLFWYWEIRPDRLIHQRYLVRVVFSFSEVVYIGPVTGNASEYERTRTWILVRVKSGQKMVVDTDDPEGFLNEMRRCLQRITLSL